MLIQALTWYITCYNSSIFCPWKINKYFSWKFLCFLLICDKHMEIYRLNKKILSQSCCAHLFCDARLIQQNSNFFFYQFSWACLSKYTWKDMTDIIKHWTAVYRLIIIGIYLYSARSTKNTALNVTDTVHIRLCNLLMAAANQHQLRHWNTQNRTYRLANRWISHGSFARFSTTSWTLCSDLF